jgi:hypothetical protein
VTLKLRVAVLTPSEPSLTNADAVLLAHDVCTAIIRTHKCGLDRTHERSSLPFLFNSSQRFKRHIRIWRCSLLTSVTIFAQNGRMSLRCRKESSGPLLTPDDCTHVSSELRLPGHWSPHRPAPQKGSCQTVRVTAAMNPRELKVSSPKA